MKTITFYSYKGGVGRTLALSNVATRLAEFGKRVCLIDFDLEAPGIPFKFKNFKPRTINLGLVDYIHHYAITNQILEINSITYKVQTNKNSAPIDLIPAGNIASNDYWRNLAQISWNDLFYKENSQGVSFFIDLKARIEKELSPDFLLIDSRTGITEISGIAISLLADEVVIIAANNIENLEGVKQVITGMLRKENQLVKPAPTINLVMSRIPYSDKPEEKVIEEKIINRSLKLITSHLDEKRIDYKMREILIIHSDRELEIQETFKMGYKHSEQEIIPIAQDYLNLFERLTSDIFTGEEISKFNNIKESENFIEQSRKTTDIEKQIELLKKAIQLHPESEEAHAMLTYSYYHADKYEESIDYATKTLLINPQNAHTKLLKSWSFVVLNKFVEAQTGFESVIENEDYPFYIGSAFHGLATIRRKQRLYSEALKYHLQALEKLPDSANSHNSVADAFRLLRRYNEAKEHVYKSIEMEPKYPYAYGTLAEINSELGNREEFFKNLELSIIFGMKFIKIYKEEPIYKNYRNDERFIRLMNKYNIDLNQLQELKN